jgi:hypothetical protein
MPKLTAKYLEVADNNKEVVWFDFKNDLHIAIFGNIVPRRNGADSNISRQRI